MSTISSSMGSSTQWANMQSKLFDKLDSNSDGGVSQDEFVSGRPSEVTADMAANLYSSLNTSGTSALSKTDFISAMQSEDSVSGPSAQATSGMMSMMMDRQSSSTSSASSSGGPNFSDLFASMDGDGDGSVSESEFLASKPDDMTTEQATQLFSSIDTTGTGSITKDQLAASFETAGGGNGMQGPGGPRPDFDNASSTDSSDQGMSVSDMFSSMDTDGNGTVTEAEFLASKPNDVSTEQATQLYNSIDTTGTGSFTEDQLDASMKANAPSGPPPGPPPADSTSSTSSTDSTTSDASSTADDLLKQLLSVIQNFNANYTDASSITANATSSLFEAA
jgi:Ca2+-binding EF-hand superfamily protein